MTVPLAGEFIPGISRFSRAGAARAAEADARTVARTEKSILTLGKGLVTVSREGHAGGGGRECGSAERAPNACRPYISHR